MAPPQGLRIILINRSLEPQVTGVAISGLEGDEGDVAMRRFEFSARQAAPFIGRRPVTTTEGRFADVPGDAVSARSLEPLEEFTVQPADGAVSIPVLNLPPVSLTILVLD